MTVPAARSAGGGTYHLPLDGLRVLQLGDSVRASYGTRLLADLGASVSVLARRRPTPVEERRRWLEAFFDLDKEVLPVAGTVEELTARLDQVVASSDLVIVDLVGDAAGPVRRALQAAPAVVWIADGLEDPGPEPWPELLVQAAGGWVYPRSGDPTPVVVGGRLGELTVGAYAALAGLIGVFGHDRSGSPQTVDVSAVECLRASVPLGRFFGSTRADGALDVGPPGMFRCRDGWVGINCLTGQHWLDFCNLAGLPEYGDRLAEVKQSRETLAQFRSLVPQHLVDQDQMEVVELCQLLRIPAAPVATGESMPSFAHWQARGVFGRQLVGGEELTVPRSPFRFNGDPGPGPDGAPAGRAEAGAEADTGPLAGFRALDLGSFWAAPYITSLLGALGVDVVKVEGPTRPDGFRYFGVTPELGEDWSEQSPSWQAANLSKRGIALDLSTAGGRDALLRLASVSDAVVENYSPRVFEQFGITGDVLLAHNRRLSVLRMPAFGLEGPWRDFVGWAAVFEEVGGSAHVTGFPGGPPSIAGGQSDPIAGVHGAIVLLASMRRARRTGVGSSLEVAVGDVMAYLSAEQVLWRARSGETITRSGNRGPAVATEGVYRGSDGDWVALSVLDDTAWEALVQLIGDEGLSGWAAWSVDRRRLEADRIDTTIADWVAAAPAAAARSAALGGAGVTAAVVVAPGDLVRHDRSGLIQRFVVPGAPEGRTFIGWPFVVNGHRLDHRSRPPRLGEHTRAFLAESGFTAAEIGQLEETGVALATDGASDQV